MSNSLLPPNATDQERDLELTVARLDSTNTGIKSLWNPENCPPEFLPWLAWAMSVDSWDSNWTEEQKRQSIKESTKLHLKKGTIGAVKDALSLINIDTEISEWWETGDQAGTFKVSALAVSYTHLTLPTNA